MRAFQGFQRHDQGHVFFYLCISQLEFHRFQPPFVANSSRPLDERTTSFFKLSTRLFLFVPPFLPLQAFWIGCRGCQMKRMHLRVYGCFVVYEFYDYTFSFLGSFYCFSIIILMYLFTNRFSEYFYIFN